MKLWPRKHHASRVAVPLIDEQACHDRNWQSARSDTLMRNDVGLHPSILKVRALVAQARSVFSNRSRTQLTTFLPMRILVTGATGKVGSRLSKRLAQRGHQVRALVRDHTRAADLREAGIELAEGDLLVAASLAAAVRGVDAVVHCAAFFRGATAEQAHAVNDLGTQHLANAARDAAVKRFIFASTGLVYGPNGGPAREDDPCAPIDSYPLSKLAAERFLLAQDRLDVRVLRLPFVYGDGDPHIEEVIPFMRTFPPAQRLSIAHHVDVAQAFARLLDAPSPPHRIYNVVDDESPDLATLFASVGQPPPDGSNAERARAFATILDGSRIREDLGFMPKFPRLADAIAAGQ